MSYYDYETAWREEYTMANKYRNGKAITTNRQWNNNACGSRSTYSDSYENILAAVVDWKMCNEWD